MSEEKKPPKYIDENARYALYRSYEKGDQKRLDLEIITIQPLPEEFFNELRNLLNKYTNKT